MRSTSGCAALAAAVFVLWLLLAGDAAPETIVSGLVIGIAVAAWARLFPS